MDLVGIKNGMVMQRDETGRCAVFFEAGAPVGHAVYEGAASGTAGLEAIGGRRYRLGGIPAGGPYTVHLGAHTYSDIYVGDVWLLAGQSNMEGVGWQTAEDEAFEGEAAVRALFMTNEWGPAKHPLHDLGHAHFKVHALLGGVPRPMFNSVGPGLAFAARMHRMTGVPQGVICCAHGGTSLAQWDPADRAKGPDASLYAAMARRFEENGGHVRGLFWYQGCSDAEEAVHADYTRNLKGFIAACRSDFGEALPVVQVQIGRTVNRPDEDWCRWWNSIQEQQRLMHGHIARLYTVAAIGHGLDDAIHIDNAGQRQIGSEAAEAMYHLLYGTDENGCLPPPELRSCSVREDEKSGLALVDLRYANLHGGLAAQGRPLGFEVRGKQGEPMIQLVFKTTLSGDTATLHLALPMADIAGYRLYHGYGQDPACNVTDMAGRGLPVMGPLELPVVGSR